MVPRLVAAIQAPAGWDAWLQAARGTLFHCSAWAAYVASAVRGCTPFFLRLVDQSATPQAMALAFHTQSNDASKGIPLGGAPRKS